MDEANGAMRIIPGYHTVLAIAIGLPETARGGQEIFAIVNPYGKYSLGRARIAFLHGGPNRARRYHARGVLPRLPAGYSQSLSYQAYFSE